MNRSRDTVFLATVIFIAALLRLHFLYASHFVIDADEAIVGLMAKHIMEGKGIPTFYYGQHYMGSLEPILVSIVFSLFGISNAALKSIPFIFSLALIPLIYRLFFEIAGRNVARITALLIAVPPIALVEWSTKARGGFIEIIFIGTYALLLTCRWIKNERKNLPLLAAIAFLLGVGWWVNNQIVYFMVPIAIAVQWRIFDYSTQRFIFFLQAIFVSLLFFLLGGLPYWVYNVQHEFISLQMLTHAAPAAIPRQIAGLFTTALPILFGAQRFWHEENLFFNATWIVYGMYLLFFGIFIFDRRKTIGGMFRGTLDREAPWEIIGLLIVIGCLSFSTSSFGYLVQAPRYLLPLYVGFFGIVAFAINALERRSKVMAGALLGIIVMLHLASCYLGGLAIPGEPFVYGGQRVAKNHRGLIGWLREHSISHVRTNYWIGYRLAFETKEAVTFSMFEEPYQIRIPEYQQPSERTSFSTPLIVVPAQAQIIRLALNALNTSFQEALIDGYVIFYNLNSPPFSATKLISPSEYTVRCSVHQNECIKAFDRDINTRWGSGMPQAPGMFIRVDFLSPQLVSAFSFDLGKWRSDYARGLEVSIVDIADQEHLIYDSQTLKAIEYFIDGNSLLLPLPESFESHQGIIFRQVGKDSFYDWSMAEINLFKE